MIDTHCETWKEVKELAESSLAVDREFLENPDYTDHDQNMILKGRISLAKEILFLPKKKPIAVINKE